MRTTTAQQDTDLQALSYGVHMVVEVQNADATWIRLDNLSGFDWAVGVEITQDLDRPVPQATVTFRRDREDSDSLAPLMEASGLNVDDLSAYAPLLDAGRALRIRTAVVAAGVTPTFPGDYQTVFDGVIDVVEWGSDPVRVIARNGPGQEASDAFIESRTVYADPADTLDVVAQAILTDWTGLTLDVPVTPSFVINPYPADGESVLVAIQRLASLIGWVVEDRWSNTAGEFRLTLYEPDRAATVPDWTFGPEDYFSVARAEVNRHGIRNAIDVVYLDGGTTPTTVSVTDAPSITRYGRRFMRVTEGSDSPIDTNAEATTLANAILSDLADPDAELEVEARYFWPVQLGDLLRFTDNAIHFDTSQDLAVSAFRHVLEDGFGRTYLSVRGSPSGGYRSWQVFGRREEEARDDPRPVVSNAYLRTVPAIEAGASAGIGEDIRPDADITVGSHTENGPGANLFQVLDEATFDDADYVTSPNSLSACPTTDDFTFEVGLGNPVGTPADSTEQAMTVRYRVRRGTANAGTADFIVSLVQGTTVVAQWTELNVGTAFTQFNRQLSNAEVDAITNHNDLRVRVTSRLCSDNEVNPITGETSWVEVAYTPKTPSVRGQYVDLVYEVNVEVDEMDLVVRWDDGDGVTSYSYTLAGIGGADGSERLEGPGAVDFFMRETWTTFSVDVTPVAQPRDESGTTVTLFLEDATETSSGGVTVALTAGGTAYADRFVPGANITIDTDAAGRPRIVGAAGGAGDLDGLSDVTITAATEGQVLRRGVTDWENVSTLAIDGSGTAATPAYGFLDDAGVGIYRPAADTVALTTGGVGRFQVANAGASVLSGQMFLQDGAVGAPGLTFSSDTDTGVYLAAAGQLYFTAAGVNTFRVFNASVQVTQGVEATPGLGWLGNSNTGLFRPVANAVGISANGVESFRVDAGGILTVAGTALAPSIAFLNDDNTGAYSAAAGALGLVADGVERVRVTSGRVNVLGPVVVGSLTQATDDLTASDLLLAAGVLAFGDQIGGVNVDHMWHDDTLNEFHFVSDGARQANGNAALRAGSVRVQDGAVGAPSLTFASDQDSGLYRIGVNDFALVAGGANALRVTASLVYPYFQVRHILDGTIGAPSYSWDTDPDTGFYLPNVAQIGVAVAGGQRGLWAATAFIPSVQVRSNDAGGVAAPSYSFNTNGDIDTGMYRQAEDVLGFGTGGVERLRLGATEADFSVPVRVDDGTAAAPGFSFNLDFDTGLFRAGGDILAFAAGGSEKLRLDWVSATAGLAIFDNTQLYVAEQPELTRDTAGTVTVDWDLGNVCPIRNDGNVDTIEIDDNGMQAGGSYVLLIRYATGGQATFTWTATGTLYWVNGNAPTSVLNNVGERLVVMFYHTAGSVTLGAWYVAHS